MYVYICVYVRVYIYICVRVCMYVCVWVFDVCKRYVVLLVAVDIF